MGHKIRSKTPTDTSSYCDIDPTLSSEHQDQEERILLTMGLWCCLPKFAVAFCVFLFPLVVRLWQRYMGNRVQTETNEQQPPETSSIKSKDSSSECCQEQNKESKKND